MFKETLLKAGLNNVQAEILGYLYQQKEAKASEIAQKTKRSRAIVYQELENMANLSLIEKKEAPGKIAVFCAGHPSLLKNVMDQRLQELQKDQRSLEGSLPDIISSYNLVNDKPGVRFFEGIEGVKQVLWDSLTSKEEISSYADVDSLFKYTPSLNDEYIKQRVKLNIKKRGLMIDTPFARKFLAKYNSDITQNRFIANNGALFTTIMQIYDQKISYITLSDTMMIGVIIEDKNIYQMHSVLFEDAWKKAKTLDQLEALSKAA